MSLVSSRGVKCMDSASHHNTRHPKFNNQSRRRFVNLQPAPYQESATTRTAPMGQVFTKEMLTRNHEKGSIGTFTDGPRAGSEPSKPEWRGVYIVGRGRGGP